MVNIIVQGRSVTLRPPRFTVGFKVVSPSDETFTVDWFLKRAGETYDVARQRAKDRGFLTPRMTFDLTTFCTEPGADEDTKTVSYRVYRWGVEEFDPDSLIEDLTKEAGPPVP